MERPAFRKHREAESMDSTVPSLRSARQAMRAGTSRDQSGSRPAHSGAMRAAIVGRVVEASNRCRNATHTPNVSRAELGGDESIEPAGGKSPPMFTKTNTRPFRPEPPGAPTI